MVAWLVLMHRVVTTSKLTVSGSAASKPKARLSALGSLRVCTLLKQTCVNKQTS
jgi:hypothetical protein